MGDSVIVVGEVSEFCWDDGSLCDGPGTTEIYQPEDIYIISNNNPIPEPILVNSGDALQEQYEGVLIKLNNVDFPEPLLPITPIIFLSINLKLKSNEDFSNLNLILLTFNIFF